MFPMFAVLLAFLGVKSALAGLVASVLTLWSLGFFLFWGIVALIVFGEIIFKDTYWPIGVIGVGIILLLLFTGELPPVWETVGSHPYLCIGAVVLYFIIATGWVIFRYGNFIRKMTARRHAVVGDFLAKWETKFAEGKVKTFNNTSVAEIDSGKMANWFRIVGETSFAPVEPEVLTTGLDQHIRDARGYRSEDFGTATEPPLWTNHKKAYAAYFAYWPFDFVAYVLGDLIKDIWSWVANRLQSFLDAFARNQMSRPPIKK